ncbi:tetratricopeptide repeat protein [Patescibacteria group bacterium]|nr:tetratricopeptide repeat protein [Patescibacteria group bacterium]
MYIIPIAIIILSIGTILVIVIRNAPQLSNLRAESVAEIREDQFKDEMISKKLKRSIVKWQSSFFGFVSPLLKQLVEILNIIKLKALEIKEKNKAKTKFVDNKNDQDEKIDELFQKVDSLIKKGDFDACEKLLISIIELDHKNVDAFATLGQIYYEKKSYNEARQTLEHALKLGGEDDETYFDLALISKEMEDYTKSLEYIKKAISLNENNPRYLDSLLETALKIKDRSEAITAYEKLKQVNPDNKKLEEFKKMVDEL